MRVEVQPGAVTPRRPSRRAILEAIRHPIIMLSCANIALVFGSYYCLVVMFPTVLEGKFGFNTAETGLAYLAPGRFSSTRQPVNIFVL
jgi:CTD nuclear envelope phosphatase 1